MAMLEREFYRNARGPTPTDEDAWVLVYDDQMKRLFVRHEWHATGHSGVLDYTIDEFVAEHGLAADALVDLLFERTRTHA